MPDRLVGLRSVAIATTLALAACGSQEDGSTDPQAPAFTASAEDQAAIANVAVEVVTSADKDAKRVCSKLLTANLVKTVYKTQKICIRPSEDESPEDLATGATVTAIVVNGDTATAVVTDQGGIADGASGTWTFVRTGGKWRVDKFGVDYLRTGVAKTVENHEVDDPSDPFSSAEVRTCVVKRLATLDQEEFLTGTYELFRQTRRGTQFLVEQMLECGQAEVSPGISLLRTIFERGIREGLIKQGRTAAQADCVVAELRAKVSDAELNEVYRSGKYPDPVATKFRDAGLSCAGATGASS